MKLVRWQRFTWDLNHLPEQVPAIPPQYTIRAATKEELLDVHNVVLSCFLLDMSWNDASDKLKPRFERQFQELADGKLLKALVLIDGKRVVGASMFTTEEDTDWHLLSGPCLLCEYGNRGLGTALLYQSLVALKEAGLTTVHGVTKEGTPAAKFVYSKFHSSRIPYDFESARNDS